MTTPAVGVPGYVVGSWNIDPANSDVSFAVRHLGVSKARGRFNEVAGKIITSDTIENSSVSATINADSIDTGFGSRDSYIKGDDVLAVSDHKELTFVSTRVRRIGPGYEIDGDLTIRGVTRAVTLAADIGGFADDSSGNKVLGVFAKTSFKRSEFGFCTNIPQAIVGEDVEITLDIYAAQASD